MSKQEHTPGPWKNVAVDILDGELRYRNPADVPLILAAPDLLAACERAEKLIDAILSFYGEGLDVANWHQNGDLEPFDNFIDENSDGRELEDIRAAIARAKGAPQ